MPPPGRAAARADRADRHPGRAGRGARRGWRAARPAAGHRPADRRCDRPRFASTVRPEPMPVAAADGLRQSPQYLELRSRFPVLDGRDDLVDELLDLFTPRNLYALHAIGAKIETEFRDRRHAAVMRLALAACLLPASRLNGYPGRVASLRITGGHVRQPASRHQREVNVWRAFEQAYRDVRDGGRRGRRGRHETRFAADYGELGGMGAANVLWLRCRPAVVGPVPAGRGRRPRPRRPAAGAVDRRAVVRVPRHGLDARTRGRRDAAAGADLRSRRPPARAPRPPPCATAWPRRSGR